MDGDCVMPKRLREERKEGEGKDEEEGLICKGILTSEKGADEDEKERGSRRGGGGGRRG